MSKWLFCHVPQIKPHKTSWQYPLISYLDGVSDGAREVSEEVEFENWRESLAKWCTWGISDVEFDEIWLPINPGKS